MRASAIARSRALLRRELPRIAGDGTHDLAEARIFAQQIRQAIAHERLLLQAGDDRRVGELGARRRLGTNPGVEAPLQIARVAAAHRTHHARQRQREQARMQLDDTLAQQGRKLRFVHVERDVRANQRAARKISLRVARVMQMLASCSDSRRARAPAPPARSDSAQSPSDARAKRRAISSL